MTTLLEVRTSGLGLTPEYLAELYEALRTEDDLRGAVRLETGAPEADKLGVTPEMISIILGPGGIAGFTHILVTWIKQHRSKVSIRIKRSDGAEIELNADRIKLSDSSQLREVAREAAIALEAVE